MRISAGNFLLINILLTGAFYVFSFVALGSTVPNIESTGAEIAAWFSENGSNARTYAWASTFVSLGLMIFAGQVSVLLPAPHRYVFFAGVLGFALTAQVQAWIWAGLAYDPSGLSEGTAQMIFAIAAFWGPIVNASTTAMAGAIAVLGFGEHRIVPHWLAWLSLAFGIEQAIETITVFGQSGFIAPGGTMNIYLGGVFGFIWVGGVVRWSMQKLKRT
ncbi:hypothetical protein SAMN05444358_1011726 [Ruegeria halocynthiae]|uniref:Uncharacterized protein n=2 Tax=Ruegeria halocynthiae TaxID=985054 RepID=A0A1H2WBB9_9RHOB|nr:hypothetical protein SAMN05444358_1011726 [Ruegeria halocynthiae]